MDFAAQISFTGVASVGGLGIRDLISKVVAPVTRASELQAVVGSLATAGTDAIKNVALDKRFVTILLAVTQGGKLPRVFLISNADRPDAARLQSPLGVLEVHEVVALSPRALICGLTAAVSLADRKLLRQLVAVVSHLVKSEMCWQKSTSARPEAQRAGSAQSVW